MEGLHPSSNVPRLCIPPNEGGRGLISVKGCVDDENRSIARHAVETTDWLVTTAAEELNFVSYVERPSKRCLITRTSRERSSWGNFWKKQ